MAVAGASCAASSDCAAFNFQAPLKRTCRATLTTSFRGASLKRLAPSKCNAQRIRLHPVLATKHYLVKKISGAELNRLLEAEREKPMVVDFYAAWCGPCVILAQEIEKLAVEFGHEVMIVKIDTDDEYELANRLQIRGLPTVLFISKDPQKSVLRAEGIFPHDVYRKIIREELLCKQPVAV